MLTTLQKNIILLQIGPKGGRTFLVSELAMTAAINNLTEQINDMITISFKQTKLSNAHV